MIRCAVERRQMAVQCGKFIGEISGKDNRKKDALTVATNLLVIVLANVAWLGGAAD